MDLPQYFTKHTHRSRYIPKTSIYLPIIVRIQHFNNFILHIHNTMPSLFHTITNGLRLGDPLQIMSKKNLKIGIDTFDNFFNTMRNYAKYKSFQCLEVGSTWKANLYKLDIDSITFLETATLSS